MLAVAMRWVPDDIDIVLSHVYDAEIDADSLRDQCGVGIAFVAIALGKSGCEIEPDHIEILLHDHSCGQYTIEPTRYKGNCLLAHKLSPSSLIIDAVL